MTPLAKNTFLFLLLLRLLGSLAYAMTSFDIASADFSKMKFVGDAHLINDSLTLTRVTSSPSSGAGGVFYRNPIELLHSVSGIPLSFSTKFSLLITNSNREFTGGGAAFVICPDDDQIGGAGERLGVPRGAIAVEFDTKMDEQLGDINGNHVGVNLGTMISSKVINLGLFKIDLRTDGRPLNAWIDYTGVTRQLKIYVSYRDGKPKKPVLSTHIDLIGRYVKKHVYVGLTASTQSSTETHSVGNWHFRSSFMDTGSSSAVQPPVLGVWNEVLGVIVPLVIVVAAMLAAAAGSIYCIRHAQCCNDCCNNLCI